MLLAKLKSECNDASTLVSSIGDIAIREAQCGVDEKVSALATKQHGTSDGQDIMSNPPKNAKKQWRDFQEHVMKKMGEKNSANSLRSDVQDVEKATYHMAGYKNRR